MSDPSSKRRLASVSDRLHRRRCVICGRHGDVYGRHLEEQSETSTATRATWPLCDDCYAAVSAELARARLRTPARVWVALGVVAAERAQAPRYRIWDERYWEQLSDTSQDRLLIWLFGIAFAVHALAFMLVAFYIAITH